MKIKMSKFIIAYDLHKKDNKSYQELYDTLENYKALQIQESLYTLKSEKTAAELRDIFTKYIHKDDNLFLGGLDGWASWNSIKTPKDL